MMRLLRTLLLLAFIPLGLVSCHNGNEPADQEKTLDHLIFEEICYSGTWHEQWNQVYKEDWYIKITNPTSHPMYVDGMGIALSALNAKQVVNLKGGTDIRETHFGAGVLMRFPGKPGEMNYPVKPGGYIILAKVAVDHRSGDWMFNPASYDLSNVDFEWQTPEEIDQLGDFEENPNVPNLRLVYPESRGVKDLIQEGYAIALVNLPPDLTDEKLLELSDDNPYIWNTSYTTDDTGGGHGHGGKMLEYLKFPYDMIVDAVMICAQNSYAWSVIPGADKGYASIYDTQPEVFTPRSLYRKHDGVKFVDDDNSTTDFEVRPASLAKTE